MSIKPIGSTYLLGSTIRVSAKFKVANTLTDPDTVIVTVKNPDKDLAIHTFPDDDEVVNDGDGLFHIDIVGDDEGQWYYRIEGTGGAPGVSEGAFYIGPSLVISS